MKQLKREKGIEKDELPEHPLSIGSMDCFDEYEKIQQAEFISTILTVNLASKFLSPNGLIIFNGSKSVMHGLKNAAPLEHIAKGTVMQQALNLSVNKFSEGVVWDNSVVNTFVCDNLIQDRNKAMFPAVNHATEWSDMKHVAHMFKYWAAGENRPINGSVYALENQGSRLFGRYVMPKFYN